MAVAHHSLQPASLLWIRRCTTKRIDNPELKRKILDHLSDLYKIKEVREANHLSSYITCRTRSFLDHQQAAEPTDQEVLLFSLGYGLQDVLTPKDANAPIITKDGIIYSPDMILSTRLNEIKTTRKSAKYHFMDDSLPVTWIDYMMGGCNMTDQYEYDLIILYMMGNYCLHPSTRVLRADLTWTPLDSIKVGDILVGLDEEPEWGRGKRRKIRYTTVLSVAPIKLNSFVIVLKDDRVVIASGDHRWLEVAATKSAHLSPIWTKTSDLVFGSKLRQLGSVWQTQDSYDAGYLAASLDSEGNMEGHTEKTHGLRVGYSQNAGATFDRVVSLWQKFGIPTEFPETKTNTPRIRTPSMDAALKLLGSIRPKRLLNTVNLDGIGLPMTRSIVEVDAVVPIGITELVGIETSSKTLIAEGIVSHNSPPFPDIYAETIQFTVAEMEDNWQKILAQKTVLDEAIATGTPPEPFKHCYDWECRYCRYKLVCETIARASGATMSEEQLEEEKELWD